MHTLSLIDVDHLKIKLPATEAILMQIIPSENLQLRQCTVSNLEHKAYLMQRAERVGWMISPEMMEGLRGNVIFTDNKFYAWVSTFNVSHKVRYAKRSLDAHREATQ
jgi:hypothetical protein